jgi:hypothetical protein
MMVLLLSRGEYLCLLSLSRGATSSAGYPQHPVFFGTGAAVADAQPHPAPPVDFTSASRAQQASVPLGAGPPQQAPPSACAGFVDV